MDSPLSLWWMDLAVRSQHMSALHLRAWSWCSLVLTRAVPRSKIGGLAKGSGCGDWKKGKEEVRACVAAWPMGVLSQWSMLAS